MNPLTLVRSAGMFDAKHWNTPYDVKTAMLAIEKLVTKDNAQRFVKDIVDHESNDKVALAFTSIHALKTAALDSFPTSAKDYSTSLGVAVLTLLSNFFLVFDHNSQTTQRNMVTFYKEIQAATQVANAIAAMPPWDHTSEEVPITRVRGHGGKSQKEVKRARRIAAVINSIDKKPFALLNLSVPESRNEYDDVENKLLSTMKAKLEARMYLYPLLTEISEEIVERSVAVFISEDSSVGVAATESLDSDNNDQSIGTAALLFNGIEEFTIEGFGQWQILINNSAIKALREKKKKESKVFDIILKKINELSNGNFSPDNQKRLEGLENTIPVFEAKMTRDSRLIYQIDVVPYDGPIHESYNAKREREVQAVKIIDVCTHAQMDRRLKDTLRRQITRKGNEYRDRCTVRVRADQTGKNICVPAVFPALPEDAEHTDDLLDLPLDDPKQTHTRFFMEKFVSFSKPLLNSIIADLDITFPHLVSSREKEIIEHPYSCYVVGRSGTGKTTTMLFKMLKIERIFMLSNGDMPRPRQMFVTQSRVLAWKVQEYFNKLTESLRMVSWSADSMSEHMKSTAMGVETDLVHIDDLINWQSELPKRFSELRDQHFPLITTVDQVWSMIEADIDAQGLGENAPKALAVKTLTYEIFVRDYWAHFPRALVKKLDPSLIFSEIMGVIKGSEEALKEPSRFLPFATYESLSKRRHSVYAEHRAAIYNIFQHYVKKKLSLGHHDSPDRTHNILSFLNDNKGTLDVKIDYLYVDEVQDNLLIDTLVLRALCRDSNGLFWGGDTAQTISVGSAFRFNDLRSFQWRIEKQMNTKFALEKVKEPQIFQLAINYRSHAGIVNCAHSVISLITEFWKDAIDLLVPERGVVDGLKPVFFSGDVNNSLQFEEFLFGDSGNPIEFGAQQCIIVRDEAARERLQAQVGEVGLIMTIYESKGLEFNDVLLFDFFRDSYVESAQWRVILNALEWTEPVPSFDPIRHASVCTELKFLYVAITRARENLWIADLSPKSSAIKAFWEKQELIQIVTPGINAPKLATSSTPEEWAEMGNNLFGQKKYYQARHCFQRALLPGKVAVANAYILREDASKITTTSKEENLARNMKFVEAAVAFCICAKDAHTPDVTITYFRNGANCYREAGEKTDAAKAYVLAHEYNSAVPLYADVGMFDIAIEISQTHESEIQAVVMENVLKRARLHYFKRKDLRRASQLFESFEEEREYLEERGLTEPLALQLESHGAFSEAAELHLEDGRPYKAIELFLRDGDSQHATATILENLWKISSFNVDAPAIQELLHLASKLDRSDMPSDILDQLDAFEALSSRNFKELRIIGMDLFTQKRPVAAALCFDHYFRWSPLDPDLSIATLGLELQAFKHYTDVLSHIAFDPDPGNNADIRLLFCISSNAGRHSLHPGTFLHSQFCSANAIRLSDKEIDVDGSKLRTLIREELTKRLRKRINAHNDQLQKVKALIPCLTYAASNFHHCPRVNCPEQHLPGPISPIVYNARISLVLQQISILHTLTKFEHGSKDLTKTRRYWMGRLYDALHPALHVLGNVSILDTTSMPRYAIHGLTIAKDWVRDLAYNLDFHSQFLTELLRLVSLASFFDKQKASEYLYKGPYIQDPPSAYTYWRKDKNCSIITDAIASMQVDQPWSISSGIAFLSKVVVDKLLVNITVLCDYIDYLCTLVIVSTYYSRDKSLDYLMLPYSWFFGHMKSECLERTEQPYFLRILPHLTMLLDHIHIPEASFYLLYSADRSIDRLPYSVRAVFISRICRSMCLLGYNINNYLLRQEILTSLQRVLRPLTGTAHMLYSTYVGRSHWDDLARATRRSLLGCELDEMIVLYSIKKKVPPEVLGVRRIAYDNPYKIKQALLDQDSLLGVVEGGSLEEAPESAEHQLSLSEPFESSTETNNIKAGMKEDTTEDDRNEDDSDMPPDYSQSYHAPSKLEISSAVTIQRKFRHHRLYRQSGYSDSDGMLAEVFEAYLFFCQKMRISHAYRCLYLGPVVHLYRCLTGIDAELYRLKTEAKVLLKNAQSTSLAEVDDQLTSYVHIIKKAKKLLKAVEPSAVIHQRGSEFELKKVAQEAVTFIEEQLSSSFSLPPETCTHLILSYKGILQEEIIPKKMKPELNTEDL